jgi:putative DNA primase/helicase
MNQINAASVIEALGGNPSTGMCRCPAHDDNSPSLKITDGDKAVLLKCFAGCSHDAVIGALRARGIWPRRTGPKIGTTRANSSDPDGDEHTRFMKAMAILRAAMKSNAGRPSEYLMGRGIKIIPPCAKLLPARESERLIGRRYPAMVLSVVNEKGLTGAHVTSLAADGKKKLNCEAPKKAYGLIKGGYVPLGLIDAGKPLIIAEGVENALSAMQIAGLPGIATVGVSGMKSVAPPACSEIIIAADNDKPGKDAANALALRLAISGRKVRIAVPEGPDGYDWNDALRSGDDQAELRKAILESELVEPPREVLGLSVEDFMNLEFLDRDYLLRPWLPSGGLVMVHAQRGTVKTFFALSAAYAVATGKRFLTWKCERQKRVLYIDGELPGKLLQTRLGLLGEHAGDMFVLSREQFHLKQQLMPDLGTEGGRMALDRIIERQDPGLIILDSLSTLVRSGVENEADSWAPVQDWLMQHRWRGRTIVLIHHEGRSNKPRGTSKREDVLDTMIGLKKYEPKPGELPRDDESTFELEFTKHREFYGADAAPMVLHLSTASGVVEWRSESAQCNRLERIAELLREGWKQRDIAKELGISEGRVAQLKKTMAT